MQPGQVGVPPAGHSIPAQHTQVYPPQAPMVFNQLVQQNPNNHQAPPPHPAAPVIVPSQPQSFKPPPPPYALCRHVKGIQCC